MRFFKLIFILLFIDISAQADVIFPPFVKGITWSFEGMASYEEPFSKCNTVNLWGGLGFVSSVEPSEHPAFGLEAALELRQYFKKNSFQGFNLGIYLGFASMYYPVFVKNGSSADHFLGIVPGLKLTYKVPFNSWLAAEPYLSFSTPWFTGEDQFPENLFSGSPGWLFTFGIRIGLNRVNK